MRKGSTGKAVKSPRKANKSTKKLARVETPEPIKSERPESKTELMDVAVRVKENGRTNNKKRMLFTQSSIEMVQSTVLDNLDSEPIEAVLGKVVADRMKEAIAARFLKPKANPIAELVD